MIPELSLVKASLKREAFDTINSIVQVSDLPKEIQGLYRCLQNFYLDTEHNELSLDDLQNYFFSTAPKDRDFYIQVFDNLRTIDVTTQSAVELCTSLRRGQLLRELSMAAYNASEGNTKALEQVREQLAALDKPESEKVVDEYEFVTDNLDELLSESYLKPGLRWRLNSLNRALGSLRKGDFGFIFARPETGKTTFLASEGSFMAEQAKQQELGPILHLNNEEQHDKVKLRYYQATLGATLAQILSNREKADRMFKQHTGGKILIPRLAAISARDVERLCERFKPSLIIYDQIDKIKGFDNEREDLRLGTIYQWARELAKEFCPSIGVCQADGSGEGQKWLTMGNVANAKTSKQAEADWILGLGKVPDNGYENIRFLHLSKNKLTGDEGADVSMRHGKWECLIVPEIGRYKDIG